MQPISRSVFWFVALLTVVLLLTRSATIPLIDPDEPRFARTSIEMMRSGDLVVPSYEWGPRLVKPPLMHWIQATMFRVLGATEFSARLHSALATLGSLLILGWVVRRRFGDEGAAWAAVFFVTMPLVVAVGRLGTLDALLSVHVMAALALDLAEPKEAGAYRTAAIGALLGAAFLVKGPVGAIVPLLVILAGRTAAGRNVFPDRGPLIGFIGAWLAVVLPWGLAFVQRVGVSQAIETIRGETLERYFAGTAHIQPPWYYGPVVLIGFLPWIAPLCLALVRVLGLRKDPAARTALYAAAGLLAGLLFFSIGKGKLPNYIVPLAPLVAILVTWELGRELDNPQERTLGSYLLAGSLAVFGLTLIVVAGRYTEAPIPAVAFGGAMIYLVGALVALLGVIRRSPRWVYGTAAVTAAGFIVLAVTVLLPPVTLERSSKELIRVVPQLSTERPLVVVEMRIPSLVYYLDRVPERMPAAEVARRAAAGDDPLFVVADVDLPLLGEALLERLREVGRHGKYRVYEPRDSDP